MTRNLVRNVLVGTMLILAVGLGVVLWGTNPVTAAPNDQVINIGNSVEPKDLDPHTITGVYEDRIVIGLFEGLTSKDPKTLATIPGIAEKWDISKDNKTYTFHLRKNAKWSNGDPVTAQDFVYGITRLLNPATAGEYAAMGYYIKGAKDYNSGKNKDASSLGLKAVDAHTFQIILEEPTPFYLPITAHYSHFPVHKASVEKHGARWTRPENMITNGPFTLSKWEVNKVVTIKKSDTYYDKDKVVATEINFFPVDNQATEEKMFRTGQLHVTYDVPQDKIESWSNDKTGVYHNDPQLATYFYRLNTTRGPLKDKRVRRALALGIDRAKLIKYVAKGGQPPMLAWTPPNAGGDYKPKSYFPVDGSGVAEAKKLLAAAGYADPKKFPPIEILYNTKEEHKKIAEAVQQMLRENLGITVRLVNQEWKVYIDSMRTLNYDMARGGWVGDYNDPQTFLSMLQTNDGNNQTGYGNPKYDKLVDQAAHEMNKKKRWALYNQAEDILGEDVPYLPVYIWTRHYLKKPELQGWFNNLEDKHPPKFLSLSPKS